MKKLFASVIILATITTLFGAISLTFLSIQERVAQSEQTPNSSK